MLSRSPPEVSDIVSVSEPSFRKLAPVAFDSEETLIALIAVTVREKGPSWVPKKLDFKCQSSVGWSALTELGELICGLATLRVGHVSLVMEWSAILWLARFEVEMKIEMGTYLLFIRLRRLICCRSRGGASFFSRPR